MITVLPMLKVVVLSEDGALRLRVPRGGGPSADLLSVCIVLGMISYYY